MMRVIDKVREIEGAGLLTERQAMAYVLRDVEDLSRDRTARTMEISPNTLDNTLAAARKKIDRAEATTLALETIGNADDPDVLEAVEQAESYLQEDAGGGIARHEVSDDE